MEITAVILAGGKSRRFGSDKTLYLIEGRTMAERAAEMVRPLVKEILISVERPGKFKIPQTREVVDIYKETGPMGGIYTGILSAKTEKCIVLAGDMLNVDKTLTIKLRKLAETYPLVIPKMDGRLEPLYGIYSKELLPAMKERILAKNYALWLWLEEEGKRGRCFFYPVEKEERDFFSNINYKEDIQILEGR